MLKTRLILSLGVLALLLLTIAVTFPRPAAGEGPGDFHERHPGWGRSDLKAAIPVTGRPESPDYFQRHPELRGSVEVRADTSDYFLRHPELHLPGTSGDQTDYFQRHPELRLP